MRVRPTPTITSTTIWARNDDERHGCSRLFGAQLRRAAMPRFSLILVPMILGVSFMLPSTGPLPASNAGRVLLIANKGDQALYSIDIASGPQISTLAQDGNTWHADKAPPHPQS